MDCPKALQHIKTAITKHLEAREKLESDRIAAQDAHKEAEAALFEMCSFEIETELKLREQYDQQVQALIECGFLTDLSGVKGNTATMKTLKTGRPGFIGIDEKEYELPPYDFVLEQFVEKYEIVMLKKSQGFTRLQLTPFGMPLQKMNEVTEAFLKEKKQNGELGGKKNIDDPVRHDDSYGKDGKMTADVVRDIKYDPELSEDRKSIVGGRSKHDILDEKKDTPYAGWRIALYEDLPNLPAKGAGETKEGRKQLEAGKQAVEYLAQLQEKPYTHERGMTLEEWFVYFVTSLQQGTLIDDYQNKGKACYLLGARVSGRVGLSCWGHGLGRVACLLSVAYYKDAGDASRSAVGIWP